MEAITSVSSNGAFLPEDSGSNSSSNQSDSGVDCSSSTSSGSSVGGNIDTNCSSAAFDSNNTCNPTGEGITLRSHRVLRDPKVIVPVAPYTDLASSHIRKGFNVDIERSNVGIETYCLDDKRSEGERNDRSDKPARGPLRITFRMKRSAVLDEVIESGTNCCPEGTLGDRKRSLDRENSIVLYEPHYEILRFDASSPLHNNHSYVSNDNDEDFASGRSPIYTHRKKSKKRSKNKKKHKSREKDRDRVGFEGTRRAEFDEECDSNDGLGGPILEGRLEPSTSAELTVSPTSSGISSCSTSCKAKRLRLVIGNEPCTIIDIPPTAFEEPLEFL